MLLKLRGTLPMLNLPYFCKIPKLSILGLCAKPPYQKKNLSYSPAVLRNNMSLGLSMFQQTTMLTIDNSTIVY